MPAKIEVKLDYDIVCLRGITIGGEKRPIYLSSEYQEDSKLWCHSMIVETDTSSAPRVIKSIAVSEVSDYHYIQSHILDSLAVQFEKILNEGESNAS